MALLKLGEFRYTSLLVQGILSDNQAEGVNYCYLAMQIKDEFFSLKVIPVIVDQGEAALRLTKDRLLASGADAGDEIRQLNQYIFGSDSFRA